MFFSRVALRALSSPISRNKVRLLFGPRQAGKTALLERQVSTRSSAIFNLAESSVRRRFEADPASFGREARALPKRTRYLVIDEIQKVPALLDEIQVLHDASPARFQIFLTGSSARKLRQHSANLLPGRSHLFPIVPVCQWEAEGAERWTWAASRPPKRLDPAGAAAPFPRQSLERTLLLGNLPGIRLEAPLTAAATLAAYVENYLEEEIRSEALVRDLGAFSVFLKLAAIESGQALNLLRLSQQSGVAASTLKTYYDVLSDTFTGAWVRAYQRPGRKRLLNTPRFLLFDTGVRNAAAGLPLEDGLLASEGPRLLEQWVSLELSYRAAYLGRGYGVSFWRTTAGAEVDVVWESPKEDVPIEVKWTTRPTVSDARHVETFLDEYPARARHGLVLCRCSAPQQLTARVVALPWDRL